MTYFSAKTFILSPRSLSISSIRGPKHKPWVEQGGLFNQSGMGQFTINYAKSLRSTNYALSLQASDFNVRAGSNQAVASFYFDSSIQTSYAKVRTVYVNPNNAALMSGSINFYRMLGQASF